MKNDERQAELFVKVKCQGEYRLLDIRTSRTFYAYMRQIAHSFTCKKHDIETFCELARPGCFPCVFVSIW